MQPSLDAAIRLGLRQGASIRLTDLPTARFQTFKTSIALHPPGESRQASDGVAPSREEHGCPGCTCHGAPSDYVSLFGWTEFTSEASGPRALCCRPHPVSGDDAVAPPPRSTLAPATRVAEAIRLSAHANLGGDPMPSLARPEIPEVVAIAWRADESTRPIKRRMVQAAQVGSQTLQILGDLNHPDALHLIREALRLSFPRVVLTADLSGLAGQEDKALSSRGFTVWTPPRPEGRRKADRGKVAYRHEPTPIRHRQYVHSSPASGVWPSVGDSWQQWTTGK